MRVNLIIKDNRTINWYGIAGFAANRKEAIAAAVQEAIKTIGHDDFYIKSAYLPEYKYLKNGDE